ncbi:MAG: DnaJ domain-containing protein, partial [Nitrospina sp.]|nr:DnaJ domain-containing protein [Nitrospina sp.]
MKTRFREFKDYYKILGVAENSTDTDIKKSYRKLAL